MKKQKTYYVTTAALTLGIIEGVEDSYPCTDPCFKNIWFNDDTGRKNCLLKMHLDVHNTFEEALERAETLKSRKIAALRKQIEKLEAMSFKKMFKEIKCQKKN